MALTKAEMAEALFNQLGLNKREARELVDLFFEEVRAALSGGEQVKLSGFGNFDLRDKNQRPGRNPKTGQEIPISARRSVGSSCPSRWTSVATPARALCATDWRTLRIFRPSRLKESTSMIASSPM